MLFELLSATTNMKKVYRIAVLDNTFLIRVYVYTAICDICSDYFDN